MLELYLRTLDSDLQGVSFSASLLARVREIPQLFSLGSQLLAQLLIRGEVGLLVARQLYHLALGSHQLGLDLFCLVPSVI